MKIYLAGKVSGEDWRAPILGQSLRALSSAQWSRWDWSHWPVCDTGRGLEYTGPYVYDDHCATEGHEIAYGDKDRDACRAWVTRECFAAIRRSDLVLAWLNEDDAHGTLVEIGYAKGIGVPVVVGHPLDREIPWFAGQCGLYDTMGFPNAEAMFSVVVNAWAKGPHGLAPFINAWRQKRDGTATLFAPQPQPDPGSVYFIQQGAAGPIKIGFSDRPERRVAQLQTSTPERLRILATMPGSKQTEGSLHRRFARHRMQGEWFRPAQEILDFVASQIARPVR